MISLALRERASALLILNRGASASCSTFILTTKIFA